MIPPCRQQELSQKLANGTGELTNPQSTLAESLDGQLPCPGVFVRGSRLHFCRGAKEWKEPGRDAAGVVT